MGLRGTLLRSCAVCIRRPKGEPEHSTLESLLTLYLEDAAASHLRDGGARLLKHPFLDGIFTTRGIFGNVPNTFVCS